MKKFKILVIQMLILGNKVVEAGDEVFENQLMSKPEDLIKSGFIEEVKSSKKQQESEAKAKAKADEEAKAKADEEADVKSDEEADVSEFEKQDKPK